MVFKIIIDYYATNYYEIVSKIQKLSTGLMRVKLRDWVSLAAKHFQAVLAKSGMT